MLENLNKEQKLAVTTTEGPLLVIAGAGSGKTKVLTTRIAYILEKKLANPSEILAITFTNKAAKEMKGRVQKLVPFGIHEMQISTFHSFGLKIIKENYAELGFEKNLTILDASDSKTLIKKILSDLNYDTNMYNPNTIKNRISSCKNELIDAKGFERFIASAMDEVVHKVFLSYEKKLKTNNSLDFDDLLILPIKLFENKKILERYQKMFKYILIDEYQDTNEAQYILIKKLSANNPNVCVVGDESQSIYAFRGSNYKNILNFEKDFKNAIQIVLEQNYRSTQNILTIANNVIKNNKQRKEKNLWTDQIDGDEVVLNQVQDEKTEADYIAKKIKELKNEGEDLNEVGILYRTNAQARPLQEAMLENHIAYKVVGSYQFYGRKEIKDLLAYLKLLYNQNDDVSFMRVINEPKRGIGNKTIETLSIQAEEKNCSLYNAISEGKTLAFKETIEGLKQISEDITLTELVDEILDKTGMRSELKKENSAMADIRLENLEEFKSITTSFEENYGIISLGEFLDEISLLVDVVEEGEDVPKVSLMTIHAAKGLEFDYVFLPGVEEGFMPHCNSFACEDDIEEERRLCYVAITRARKQLWLLYTKSRMVFGRTQYSIPSRFIKEMELEGEQIETVDHKVDLNFSKNIDKTLEYKIGEKVKSDKFGEGIIVDVGEKILTVAFKGKIQKFIKGHKSLKKL